MRPHIALPALALIVGLAGCGSSSSPNAAGPSQTTASATTPPPDGGSYITPQDITVAAGDALPCATFEVNIVPENATSEVTCDFGNVIVGIYTNYATRNISTDLLLIAGKTLLTGRNWSIAATDPTLIAAAKLKLGGNYVTKSCLDQPGTCDSD